MSKILITGASGFVGKNFAKFIYNLKPVCIYNKSYLKYYKIETYCCNLLNKKKIDNLLYRINPDIIFHFAAFTNPQENEHNPKKSYNLNYLTTLNIINFLKKNKNKKLVFISTDKVYSNNLKIKEESNLNPKSEYAKNKYRAENEITKNLTNYFILRTPIVHAYGQKTSNSFIDKSLIDIKNKKKINVFSNIERCFVSVDSLNSFMKMLISSNKYGIYNIGSNVMSYRDRVVFLCNYKGISYKNLINVTTGKVTPLKQNMNTEKLKKNFNLKFE